VGASAYGRCVVLRKSIPGTEKSKEGEWPQGLRRAV